MTYTEWLANSKARFHVIAGRDELIAGRDDFAAAEVVALATSTGYRKAVMVVDTATPVYVRYFDGRRLAA